MPAIDLADYEIGGPLGTGTVGTILAAVKRQTGQQVAIKRLNPAASDDSLIRARFRREMLVMQRLNHPNIIRFDGGGEDDGVLFYVMERVDGGTVKDLLQFRGALPWPVVTELAQQVCSALQCAHNNGVVHRDLKPGNLFLTHDGDVKLGDFGIARDLQGTDLSADGMTVGTRDYMAPEQITGQKSVSGKADLYSLGCCLFEMLVGRKPFQGDSHTELFEQHLHAKPPSVRDFVPDCPAELDDVIQQLLAKDPDQRPFNARQVQGVMLRLAEPSEPAESNLPPDTAGDPGHRPSAGRELLKQWIQNRVSRPPPAEVGWRPLALMAVAIVVLVILASFFSR